MSLLDCHEKLDPELVDEILKFNAMDGIYGDIFYPKHDLNEPYNPNLFIDAIIRLLPQLKLKSSVRPFRSTDGTLISENCCCPIEQYHFNEYSPEEIQNGWYPLELLTGENLTYGYQNFISINALYGDLLELRSYLDCGDAYEHYPEYEDDNPEYVYQVMHPKFLEAVCVLI